MTDHKGEDAAPPSATSPFKQKLERLVSRIVSQGETAEQLRKNPRATLRELGFTEKEIKAIGEISFDVLLTKRNPNALNKPCFPDQPTVTIVFKSGETVTGGKFFIDLNELSSGD
jgi:hypothetical protein